MSNPEIKERPKHIPAENIYLHTHWTVYLSYFIALLALYLLINEGFFGG